MKMFILGVGHMGAWLSEALSLYQEVAVYDANRANSKNFPKHKGFSNCLTSRLFNRSS
jgi:prephenate dehydrogenase